MGRCGEWQRPGHDPAAWLGALTGQRLPALIKDVQLTVIEGGPHAIPWTHAAQVNTALLDFIRS